MSKVRFEGRIIPEMVNVTIKNHPALRWKDDGNDFWTVFETSIKDGKVVVECEIEGAPFERAKHFNAIWVRALDIARVSVNLVAFSMGLGAFVVFDTFTDASGVTTALVIQDRPLEKLCTAFTGEDESFNIILELVLREPPLFLALRDLIWAISNPHEIPPSCGSAIEAIRTLMVPKGEDRKKGWPIMQQHLRATESYIKLVTDYARGPRHGDHGYVPGTVTREIATRSWTLMNRFLEYRKRGNQPLPESEFPLLTG